MSEQRRRRQFLADALFAGGSLAAAAVATRWFLRKEPEPPTLASGDALLIETPKTYSQTETTPKTIGPEVQVGGQMVMDPAPRPTGREWPPEGTVDVTYQEAK